MISEDAQQNIDLLLANGFLYDKENDWYSNDIAGVIVSTEMTRFTYPTAFKDHIGKLLNSKLK